MDILIDPREGSKKFLNSFDGAQSVLLDAGDMAFVGNGPDNVPWFIGIEHKQVADMVACIQSGRFTGTQLPRMMEMYNICFLVIEGAFHANKEDKLVTPWTPKKKGFSYGITYKAFDNFLNSISLFSYLNGTPCIVKYAHDKQESVHIISDIYSYFQKDWGEHSTIVTPDSTKFSRIPNSIEMVLTEPGNADYPTYILKKALFQIKGFSWDSAGRAANEFGTMEVALLAGQKDWESLDRIGKVLAKRAYEALHGYGDPDVKIPKKRRKASI